MAGPATFDPLRDGFATIIGLSLLPGVKLYEKDTTPPALDGGGPIESTHMRRTVWRMKDPKTLKTLGDLVATVLYHTGAYNLVNGVINTVQGITLRWPDGAVLGFYGYVDKFTPSGHSEGNLPTANIVIVPTLYVAGTGVETGPSFTPAP